MSSLDEDRPAVSPNDVLPRVEPPTAGFIVQLFVVPAAIVVVIVLVWGMFAWLANMRSTPRQYVMQIEQNNANSWFAANKLAEELRTNEQLQYDTVTASKLAAMLDRLLDQGSQDSDAIQLRAFLCQALSQFRVDQGVPVLIRAATLDRNEKEQIVRRWAIEGLALLASRLGPDTLEKHPELMSTLLRSVDDQNVPVREAATFALGVIGREDGLARLEQLLDEPSHPGVRFNAATGLARHGRTSCISVLVEMLDPKQVAQVSELLVAELLPDLKPQEAPRARDDKRASTMINAMRASIALRKANPTADLSAIEAALAQLADHDLSAHFAHAEYASEVRAQAAATLATLRQPAE